MDETVEELGFHNANDIVYIFEQLKAEVPDETEFLSQAHPE